MDIENDTGDEKTTRYSSNFAIFCLLVNAFGYIIASTVVCRLLKRVRLADDLHILSEFFLYYKVSLVYFIVSSIFFLARYITRKWMSPQDDAIWTISTVLYLWQSLMIFYVILAYVFTRWVFLQLQNDPMLKRQYDSMIRAISIVTTQNALRLNMDDVSESLSKYVNTVTSPRQSRAESEAIPSPSNAPSNASSPQSVGGEMELIRQMSPTTARDLRQKAIELKPLLDIKTRNWRLKKYPHCFIGQEAVPILIQHGFAETESQAISFMNQLVNLKIIEHVENAHVFKNAYLFYTFLDDKLQDKRAIKVTLKQILRRQDFICIFMQHLSQEFSQELLLALIEFIQFRQVSQETLDPTTNSNELKDSVPENEISK